MPADFVNPYTGNTDQTCSVSFAAQNKMAGTVTSSQTEAQYNTSQQLGEWGVITAKLKKGEIPNGTKVLSFANPGIGVRGFLYTKDNTLWERKYGSDGKRTDYKAYGPSKGEAYIKSKYIDTSIPEAAGTASSAKETVVTKTTDASPAMQEAIAQFGEDNVAYNAQTKQPVVWTNLNKLGVLKSGSEFLYHGATKKGYLHTGVHVKVEPYPGYEDNLSIVQLVDASTGAFVSNQSTNGAKWWIEKLPSKDGTAKPVASPSPLPAVSTGSDSVGSMSHEDVAAMFVKIKDDLAKEKGLNIKGANPDLDKLVYQAIGDKTGYTADEVKAKIDAYKADGHKLSALKKKVLSGSKKVPDGNAQPTKASPAAPLNTFQHTNKPASDPQPNGVPTVATPNVANEAKAAVEKKVEAQPKQHYSDEDIAAQYIIAKDAVVAASNGKWTLYSKSDELDLQIYGAINYKTGLSKAQAQQALASYLGSGKKLSTLKKQLAKQGAFTPKADTLKSGKATPDKDKAKDVNAKADAGYTPTQEKATGTPKTDTGQAPPKAMQRQDGEAGDITGLKDSTKKLIFDKFRATGSLSYLSSGPASNYNGLLNVQAYAQSFGWGKDLSLLQILRVVDEEGAKKAGVGNDKLFEKQVATWLTTPSGTQHVKDQEVKKAKLLEQEKNKAEAAKLAAQMETNQPALPADSGQFEEWSLAKARRVSEEWLAARPLAVAEKAGLRHYTGSAYTAINNYLRGLSPNISPNSKKHIDNAKKGMRPTTEPILVKRGTGANQFLSLGVKRGDTSLLWGLTGRSFRDEGFLSTSAGGRAAFGGECLLEIECPVGTPMMYVDPFSKHQGENEMMLQAGMTYKVLQTRKEGKKFVIRMRVTDWPGKGA